MTIKSGAFLHETLAKIQERTLDNSRNKLADDEKPALHEALQHSCTRALRRYLLLNLH